VGELASRQRKRLPKSRFAYVDTTGEGHLPIHDASHARNALARFNQTEFESVAAKERARRKILNAARRYGIDVDAEDKVRRPAKALRAASTRRGPRGGKKTVTKEA
jgi:hypothetical protein